MKLNKLSGIIAALALLITGLSSCAASASASNATDTTTAGAAATANENELRTIRVGIMTGSSDQYGVYIGTEQGIFAKYGIKVDTTEYVAGINTVDAIVTGTADTGLLADFAAVNRIGNTLHDTNLVLFSELSAGSHPNGGVFVPPEYADDVTKLDGTAGWITNIGTVSEYFNWQAQTYLGLDPAKQNIVQTDSKQTSLALAQNGGATAIYAYGADAKRYSDLGWVNVATSEEIGIYVGGYLVTTKDFISENTQLLGDYLTALKESIDYISANLDDSAVKVEAKFGIGAEDFKANWTSNRYEIGFPESGAEQLDKLNDWAFSQGRFPEAYNIRDFIDTSAAEIAAPDNVTIKK